jgi:hypothetical protein
MNSSIVRLHVVGALLLGVASVDGSYPKVKNKIAFTLVGLSQNEPEAKNFPKGKILKGLHIDQFKGKLREIANEYYMAIAGVADVPTQRYVTTQLTDEELNRLASFFKNIYGQVTIADGFPGVAIPVQAGFKEQVLILNRLGALPLVVTVPVPVRTETGFASKLQDVADIDDAALIVALTSLYLVSIHKVDENIASGFTELYALSPSFAKKALDLFKERFKEKPDVVAELNKVLFGPQDKHLDDVMKSIDTVENAQEWLKMFNVNKGALGEIQKEALAKSFLEKVAPLISVGYVDELKIWKNKKPDDAGADASAGFKEIRALEKSCRGDVYALVPKKAQDDFDTGFGEAKRALFEFQRDFFIVQFEKALGKGDFTVAQDLLPAIKKYVDKYMAGDAYKKLEEKLLLAQRSGGGDLQDWLRNFSGSLSQLASGLK